MTANFAKYISGGETKPSKVQSKRYALHTTARVGSSSEDCFFGWGTSKKGELCLNHTVLRDLSYETVVWLASYFVHVMYQVVVTEDSDWGELINDGSIAVYYSPTHEH